MLEVVPDTKLVVSQDLKLEKNADFICTRARRKMWVLRRLKKFKIEISKLADVYKKEIRSLLEYAVPVWHSSITVKQSNQIERVQKEAFRIILGQDYIDYEVACTLLCMEPLNIRRTQLCLTFAKKDFKKNRTLFTRTTKTIHTRRSPQLVKEFKCRTKRYQLSSMPYLSKLLNSQCQ